MTTLLLAAQLTLGAAVWSSCQTIACVREDSEVAEAGPVFAALAAALVSPVVYGVGVYRAGMWPVPEVVVETAAAKAALGLLFTLTAMLFVEWVLYDSGRIERDWLLLGSLGGGAE
jgi:hypothetical protein